MEPTAEPQEVLFDGFVGGTALGNWTPVANFETTPIPSSEPFLGQYHDETVSLGLVSLPTHTEVTVSFDLYIIGAWDGNDGLGLPPVPDIWQFTADNISLLETTFSVAAPVPQAFPQDLGGVNAGRTGANESIDLGYASNAVYPLSFTFNHTASTLDLAFLGGTNINIAEGEGWGLDNVIVSILPAT